MKNAFRWLSSKDLDRSTQSIISRYTIFYLLFSFIWVFGTDQLLAALVSNPDTFAFFATMKGWTFVVVTALFWYGVMVYDALRIHESKSAYRDLFEQAGDYVLVLDPSSDNDLVILDANDSACRVHGFSREELIGKTIADLDVHYRQLDHSELTRRIRDGHTLRFETSHRRKDGSTFPVEVCSRLVGGKIRPAVIVSVERDVTERKRIEKELQAEATRRRLLFEQSPDGILIVDPQTTRFLDFNTAAHTQLGYSREEFARLCIFDVEARETTEETRGRISRVIQEGRGDFETLQRTKQGEIRCVHVTAQIVEIQDQQVYYCVWRDITGRKRAEDALRMTLESVGDGFFACDAEWRFVYVNAAAERLLGIRREDVVGRNHWEVFPLTVGTRLETEYRRAAAGEPQDFENYYEPWSRWFHNRCFPREGGGMSVYFEDITERKKMLSSLAHSHDLMRYVIEHNRSAVAVHDRDLKYIYVSQRYLDEYNISGRDVIGKHHYDVFPDLPQKWRDVHQRALRGEVLSAEDDPYVRENGSTDWTRWECRPWYESDGSIGGIIVYTEVVTARRRAEQALRISEEKFRKAFMTSPDAIAITRLSDDLIVSINQGFTQTMGFTEAEALGKTSFELDIWDDPGDHPRLVEGVQNDGKVENLAARFRAKDGSIINGLISASIIELDGIKHILSFIRNINERKEAEEALRNAQKLESIGTLAGGIAHDFNNLLNVVLGQISLALAILPIENPARSHLDKSLKAVDRATDLTKQLLAYSGRGKFVAEEINLNRLVEENTQLLSVSVPKTTQLQYLLDPVPLFIHGDVGQIQQVVMNIIINAGEAIGSSPGCITVRTGHLHLAGNDTEYWRYTAAPLAPGSYALIQVSDTGCGITADRVERIFDPFFTTKFTGRGLGLSAVLGIIRGHSGGIRIQSEVGTGTTFEIVFPLVESSGSASRQHAQSQLAVDGRGKTILVIDDEPSVIELVTDILTSANFSVISSSNPLDGIELYRRQHEQVKAVILDYSMPAMDGRAAFEELAKIDESVKVLLCSGYTEEETSSTFGSVRPVSFIQKPYKPSHLLERLATMNLI